MLNVCFHDKPEFNDALLSLTPSWLLTHYLSGQGQGFDLSENRSFHRNTKGASGDLTPRSKLEILATDVHRTSNRIRFNKGILRGRHWTLKEKKKMVFTAVIWEEVYYPFVSIILHPRAMVLVSKAGRKVRWYLGHWFTRTRHFLHHLKILVHSGESHAWLDQLMLTWANCPHSSQRGLESFLKPDNLTRFMGFETNPSVCAWGWGGIFKTGHFY